MNNILIDFTKDYGPTMIHSIVMGIFSYAVLDIKKIYKEHIEDKTKKEIIEKVCIYVDEIYPEIDAEDKLKIAISNSKEMLKEKKISISDLELEVLLHNSIYTKNNKLEVKW